MNRTAARCTFAYDLGAAAQVERLVEQERQCCAFLQFDLRRTPNAVHLDITAPAEAGEFAPLRYAYFVGRAARRDCACRPSSGSSGVHRAGIRMVEHAADEGVTELSVRHPRRSSKEASPSAKGMVSLRSTSRRSVSVAVVGIRHVSMRMTRRFMPVSVAVLPSGCGIMPVLVVPVVVAVGVLVLQRFVLMLMAV
jgi:hypothetical protein